MKLPRLALAIGAVIIVLGIVVAGVLLGRDSGGAQPVAVGDEPGADPGTASVPPLGEPQPSGARSEPVEASGIDPITGERVSLADYAGTPVVLNFWASWCPPCREEIPALVELAERHPEVALVGVNYSDPEAGARELQRELGFAFPSIGDPTGELGAELGIRGMPTTFFLDAEHRIRGLVLGGTDLAGFEKGLELIVP